MVHSIRLNFPMDFECEGALDHHERSSPVVTNNWKFIFSDFESPLWFGRLQFSPATTMFHHIFISWAHHYHQYLSGSTDFHQPQPTTVIPSYRMECGDTVCVSSHESIRLYRLLHSWVRLRDGSIMLHFLYCNIEFQQYEINQMCAVVMMYSEQIAISNSTVIILHKSQSNSVHWQRWSTRRAIPSGSLAPASPAPSEHPSARDQRSNYKSHTEHLFSGSCWKSSGVKPLKQH